MEQILQVCAFGSSNAGNFIASLLDLQKKMAQKGYETIYAFPERAKMQKWCIDIQKNNKVYFLPEAHSRIMPNTYIKFKKIYRENKGIRIVHSHFELYDLPASITSPGYVKVFWHLHDPIKDWYTNGRKSRQLLMRLQYGLFGKNSIMLSTSKLHSDFICDSLGFNRNNVRIIPNGMDLSRIKDSSGVKKNREFLILCWDFYRKGGDLAIKAAERIIKNRSDFKIRFVPGNAIEDAPFVIKSNPVADINEFFKTTACFLHISRSEGLSYALLEAIYAGLPVICSNIPENMVVSDCPTVFYVNNESVDDIINSMERMLDNDFYISDDAITKSRMIIEKKFSLNSWSKRVMEEYFVG